MRWGAPVSRGWRTPSASRKPIAAVVDYAGRLIDTCGAGSSIDPGEAAVFVVHGTEDTRETRFEGALSIIQGAQEAGIAYEFHPPDGNHRRRAHGRGRHLRVFKPRPLQRVIDMNKITDISLRAYLGHHFIVRNVVMVIREKLSGC